MKKKLFFINGNSCVGKSTTSRVLMKKLPNCVYLDVDWCLCMDPKIDSNETSELKYNNCYYLINNYLHAPLIDNIVFCDTISSQKKINHVLSQLDLSNVDFYHIILTINEKEYIRWFKRAIKCGKKTKDWVRIKDGKQIREDNLTHHLARSHKFEQLDGIKIDTSHLVVEQVVEKIKQCVK